MNTKRVEIVCRACGADTLIRREAVYDGFKKVGEALSCPACGHVYESEEAVPFKTAARPAIFGEDDRSKRIALFDASEKGRLCRYCRHYVVNPFTQRCGLHNRFVEATDTCPDFDPKETAPADAAPSEPAADGSGGDPAPPAESPRNVTRSASAENCPPGAD